MKRLRGMGGVLALTGLAIPACQRLSPRGTVPVERAAGAPAVVVMPDDAADTVVLVASTLGGQGSDPIGGEGLAWITAQAMATGPAGAWSAEDLATWWGDPSRDLSVRVGPERVVWTARCPAPDAEGCVDRLAATLATPPADPAGVEAARAAAHAALAEGARGPLALRLLRELVWAGHPYGHPVHGRRGALDGLTVSRAARFHHAHAVRGEVVLGLAGPVGPSLAARWVRLTEALPTHLPPDTARLAPVVPDGPQAVVLDVDGPASAERKAPAAEVLVPDPSAAADPTSRSEAGDGETEPPSTGTPPEPASPPEPPPSPPEGPVLAVGHALRLPATHDDHPALTLALSVLVDRCGALAGVVACEGALTPLAASDEEAVGGAWWLRVRLEHGGAVGPVREGLEEALATIRAEAPAGEVLERAAREAREATRSRREDPARRLAAAVQAVAAEETSVLDLPRSRWGDVADEAVPGAAARHLDPSRLGWVVVTTAGEEAVEGLLAGGSRPDAPGEHEVPRDPSDGDAPETDAPTGLTRSRVVLHGPQLLE